jgi:hypothetical protein
MFNLFAASPQLWGMSGQELVEIATSIATCLGILAAALEVAAGRLVKRWKEVAAELHAPGQDASNRAQAEAEALRAEVASLKRMLADRREVAEAGQRYVEKLIEELKSTRSGQCPRAIDGVARCCMDVAAVAAASAASMAADAVAPSLPGPEAAR